MRQDASRKVATQAPMYMRFGSKAARDGHRGEPMGSYYLPSVGQAQKPHVAWTQQFWAEVFGSHHV
jgi:hypothetical protein